VVNFAPILSWEDFNIGELIMNSYRDIKFLALGNDAKSSALAELWFGANNESLSNFVFLSVGAGIGSGIVVEKKILDGEIHASGEFGHIIIYEGGEACRCGNFGCWESYASDKATVNRYINDKYSESGRSDIISIDSIIDLALKNDNLAVKTLKQTGYYLGIGIANIVKAIDPHSIIIGGKLTKVWNLIHPEITKVVDQRAFYGKGKNVLILPTSLTESPKVIGAITLAIQEIFDDYKIMV
jgi:predicted NBD/HSP70 family sugar kinase